MPFAIVVLGLLIWLVSSGPKARKELKAASVFALIALLSGCNSNGGTVTLYRNSPVDPRMRVHWSTFDARDGLDYNSSNCDMAARLLNANVDALAKKDGKPRDESLGFWCEAGQYKKEGAVPLSFDSEFPTDA